MDQRVEDFGLAIDELADDLDGLMAAHSGDEPEIYDGIYADHPLLDLDDYTLQRVAEWLRIEAKERHDRAAAQ